METLTEIRLAPAEESLVEDARARESRSQAGRERLSRWCLAVGFVIAASFVAAFGGAAGATSAWVALGLVGLFALSTRIGFEVGSGYAIPAQLVLVPMLFVLPVAAVPLLVGIGMVIGGLPDVLSSRIHPERLTAGLASSWYVLGPTLVLLAAGEPAPSVAAFPWLLAALAAQFAADGLTATLREWWALGVSPRQLVRPLGWAFMVDALLAPVGLALAAAAAGEPLWLATLAPLLLLISVFARERQTRVDRTLELSNAYRGTALLLGDVVEADDAYTGTHSRDVVGLVAAVCEQLGLDPSLRRDAELTALLHDVGKIRIPSAIINKPGSLTPAERAVVETHTIEGEKLLARVGGLLGSVGALVRSCHERWDGRGYPDGLAGEEIPLVARIVCCCDAYSAMTTTRPYRAAMSVADALAEVEENAGTQFDPAVAAALVAVVGAELGGRPARQPPLAVAVAS
jgi:HD-GYP domain-containing protein (c-di-GMP phosphodiesterase class II)